MDTMVISPDSTIEKQKNQHTHNFERTAPPQVRSFLFGSFNYSDGSTEHLSLSANFHRASSIFMYQD